MATDPKTYSVKMHQDVKDRFEAFTSDRDLSNSEGLRRVIDRGLATYGYERSPEYYTQLQRAATVVAVALICIGASWIALSLVTGSNLYMQAGIIASTAVIPWSIAHVEPEISRRFGGWLDSRTRNGGL